MNTKKKPANQIDIKIGEISDVSGKVNIAGGDISITETTFQEQLFAPVYQAIDARQASSPSEKNDLKAEVKEVEQAIKKPEVDESFITRHLRNIGRMAPEIMDVVIATIASPAAGLGMVGKKIAEKAKDNKGL